MSTTTVSAVSQVAENVPGRRGAWFAALWLFFGYIVHFFVGPLNNIKIPILGFPLGFYMAAQGSLIAFVVMLFLFAKQQDRIDREFGVAEDD